MRIAGYRRERRGGSVVAAARLEWEEAARPALELEFAADGDAAEHILPEPNAFLLAAAFPAARRGERRIAVEGAVCPVLRDGLAAAARVLDGWYGGRRRVPAIEPSGGFRAPFPPTRRAASFLSGGVDSAEILLTDRRHFAPGHAAAIADSLLLDGFPLAHPPGSDAQRSFSERALRSARAVAGAFGVPLTRIATNLAEIEPDFDVSSREWYGAGFAAVAHLFSSRFTSVALASDFSLSEPILPKGSHPLLDPCYGSASTAFVHAITERTRLEKVRSLARPADLVASLMVCHQAPIPDGRLNCGSCEKCVRTRLELLVAGADAAPAFPGALAPSPAEITAVRPRGRPPEYWGPLIAPLRSIGRTDLAAAAEAKIAQNARLERWYSDAGWKGWLRRADRRLLAGRGLAFRRRIAGGAAS